MLKHIPFYASLLGRPVGDKLKATHSHVLVYGAIEVHASGPRGCKASNRTIAAETGLAENTVAKTICQLSACGWVKTELDNNNHRKGILPLLEIQAPLLPSKPPLLPSKPPLYSPVNIDNSIRDNSIKNNTPANADGISQFDIQKKKQTYIMKLAYDFMEKQGITIINNAIFQKQLVKTWEANGDRRMLELLIFLRDCYADYEKEDYAPQVRDYLDIPRKAKGLLDFAEKKSFEFEATDFAEFTKNGFTIAK